MSRRKLAGEVAQKRGAGTIELATVYKLQSWHTHHVMTLIKDVRAAATEHGVEVGFGFGAPSTAGDEAFLLEHARGILDDTWRLVRAALEQPPL